MVGIMKNGGRVTYDLNEYVVDAESDIELLPRNVAMGSTAFVIETGNVYMMNSKKEWVKI